jgi:hypothetical protein
MSDDQACDLLLRGLEPGMVSELLEGDLLEQVVRKTWNWPLILKLLNKVLLSRVREGYAPEAVLGGHPLRHIFVRGPGGADDLQVGLGPQGRSELVEGSLGAGFDLLNVPDARKRHIELAVFPPRAGSPASCGPILGREVFNQSGWGGASRSVAALGRRRRLGMARRPFALSRTSAVDCL